MRGARRERWYEGSVANGGAQEGWEHPVAQESCAERGAEVGGEQPCSALVARF